MGAPRDVHPAYLDFMGSKNHNDPAPQSEPEEKPAEEKTAIVEENENRWGNGDARIIKVSLLDKSGQEKNSFASGESIQIQFHYVVNKPLRNPACGIGIFRNDGLQCYGTNTQIDHINNLDLGKCGVISCDISSNLLLPGEYTLDLAIHTEDGFAYDYFRYAKTFRMYSDTTDVGVARIPHSWKIISEEGEISNE